MINPGPPGERVGERHGRLILRDTAQGALMKQYGTFAVKGDGARMAQAQRLGPARRRACIVRLRVDLHLGAGAEGEAEKRAGEEVGQS